MWHGSADKAHAATVVVSKGPVVMKAFFAALRCKWYVGAWQPGQCVSSALPSCAKASTAAAVRVIAAEGHTRYGISLACCTVHSFVLYVYVDGGASMLVARPGAVLAGTGIVFRVCLVCLRVGHAQPCSACSIAARLLLVG
jgi:hypothetical protein